MSEEHALMGQPNKIVQQTTIWEKKFEIKDIIQ